MDAQKSSFNAEPSSSPEETRNAYLKLRTFYVLDKMLDTQYGSLIVEILLVILQTLQIIGIMQLSWMKGYDITDLFLQSTSPTLIAPQIHNQQSLNLAFSLVATLFFLFLLGFGANILLTQPSQQAGNSLLSSTPYSSLPQSDSNSRSNSTNTSTSSSRNNPCEFFMYKLFDIVLKIWSEAMIFPCLQLLLSVLKCEQNSNHKYSASASTSAYYNVYTSTECISSGSQICMGILGIAVYIVMVIAAAFTYILYHNTTLDIPNARLTGKYELRLLAVGSSVILMQTFFFEDKYAEVSMVVYVLGSLSLSQLFALHIPHNNRWLSVAKQLQAQFLLASSVLEMYNRINSNSPTTLLFFFISIASMTLRALLYDPVTNSLCAANSANYEFHFHAEQQLRVLSIAILDYEKYSLKMDGFLNRHRNDCFLPTCPSRSAAIRLKKFQKMLLVPTKNEDQIMSLFVIYTLFNNNILKFRDSNEIRLLYALFLLNSITSKELPLIQLQFLLQNQPSLAHQFIVFRLQNSIFNSQSLTDDQKIDFSGELSIEESSAKFKKNLSSCLQSIISFWQELAETEVNGDIVLRKGSSATSQIESCCNTFESLNKDRMINQAATRSYTIFCLNVLKERDRLRFMMKSKDLKNQKNNTNNNNEEQDEEGRLQQQQQQSPGKNDEESLATSGIVIISSQEESLGIVTQLNLEIVKMVGTPKSQLLNKTVNNMIPATWSENHNHFIDQYLATGIKRILGVRQDLFLRNRQDYLIPVSITIKPLPSLSQGLLFSAAIASVNMLYDYPAYIVTTLNGQIDAVSPSAVPMFNIDMKKVRQGIYIEKIIPSFWEYFGDFQLKGGKVLQIKTYKIKMMSESPVRITITPIRFMNQMTQGYIVVLRLVKQDLKSIMFQTHYAKTQGKSMANGMTMALQAQNNDFRDEGEEDDENDEGDEEENNQEKEEEDDDDDPRIKADLMEEGEGGDHDVIDGGVEVAAFGVANSKKDNEFANSFQDENSKENENISALHATDDPDATQARQKKSIIFAIEILKKKVAKPKIPYASPNCNPTDISFTTGGFQTPRSSKKLEFFFDLRTASYHGVYIDHEQEQQQYLAALKNNKVAKACRSAFGFERATTQMECLNFIYSDAQSKNGQELLAEQQLLKQQKQQRKEKSSLKAGSLGQSEEEQRILADIVKKSQETMGIKSKQLLGQKKRHRSMDSKKQSQSQSAKNINTSIDNTEEVKTLFFLKSNDISVAQEKYNEIVSAIIEEDVKRIAELENYHHQHQNRGDMSPEFRLKVDYAKGIKAMRLQENGKLFDLARIENEEQSDDELMESQDQTDQAKDLKEGEFDKEIDQIVESKRVLRLFLSNKSNDSGRGIFIALHAFQILVLLFLGTQIAVQLASFKSDTSESISRLNMIKISRMYLADTQNMINELFKGIVIDQGFSYGVVGEIDSRTQQLVFQRVLSDFTIYQFEIDELITHLYLNTQGVTLQMFNLFASGKDIYVITHFESSQTTINPTNLYQATQMILAKSYHLKRVPLGEFTIHNHDIFILIENFSNQLLNRIIQYNDLQSEETSSFRATISSYYKYILLTSILCAGAFCIVFLFFYARIVHRYYEIVRLLATLPLSQVRNIIKHCENFQLTVLSSEEEDDGGMQPENMFVEEHSQQQQLLAQSTSQIDNVKEAPVTSNQLHYKDPPKHSSNSNSNNHDSTTSIKEIPIDQQQQQFPQSDSHVPPRNTAASAGFVTTHHSIGSNKNIAQAHRPTGSGEDFNIGFGRGMLTGRQREMKIGSRNNLSISVQFLLTIAVWCIWSAIEYYLQDLFERSLSAYVSEMLVLTSIEPSLSLLRNCLKSAALADNFIGVRQVYHPLNYFKLSINQLFSDINELQSNHFASLNLLSSEYSSQFTAYTTQNLQLCAQLHGKYAQSVDIMECLGFEAGMVSKGISVAITNVLNGMIKTAQEIEYKLFTNPYEYTASDNFEKQELIINYSRLAFRELAGLLLSGATSLFDFLILIRTAISLSLLAFILAAFLVLSVPLLAQVQNGIFLSRNLLNLVPLNLVTPNMYIREFILNSYLAGIEK